MYKIYKKCVCVCVNVYVQQDNKRKTKQTGLEQAGLRSCLFLNLPGRGEGLEVGVVPRSNLVIVLRGLWKV